MSNKQKQKYQLKPLMYIVQPENQDINVNMQSFVVKKSKSKQNHKAALEGNTSGNEEKNSTIATAEIPEEIKAEVQRIEKVENNQEKPDEQEQQSVKQYRKQRKPITQMNILEKIEFFTNLPKNMPRTLCQIETLEEKYRGVIMSEENNIVTIRSLVHSKPIEIAVDDIKVINLLGF